MNIQEIRKKYPQYDDMSDMDLANAFHEKYYSDIPEDEFYKKIGVQYQPPAAQQQEESNIDFFANELKGLNSQLQNEPLRPAINALSGLGSLSERIVNAPNTLSGGLIPEFMDKRDWNQSARTIFSHILNNPELMSGGDVKPGDRLMQETINRIPELFAARTGAGRLLQGAQNLPNTLGSIGNVIQRTGRDVGEYFSNNFTPSGRAAQKQGGLTAPELLRNYTVTEGTQTPLGNVIQSPALIRKFENKLATSLGSNTYEVMADIAKDIESRGQNLISEMTSNPTSSDPNYLAKELLTNAHETSKGVKNSLWNGVTEKAMAEGFKLTLPSFSRQVNRELNLIKNDPLLMNDPEVSSLFRELSGYKKGSTPTTSENVYSSILDENGQPFISETIPEKHPSISSAKFLAAKLSDEAKRLEKSKTASTEDRSKRGLYSALSASLRRDVRDSVHESGSPELQEAFNKANEFHRSNFSNYLDAEIFPLLNQNKSGESMIQEIIRPSKKMDKSERITKFNELLPDDQKELLGYGYLLNATDKEGNVSPRRIVTLINALGDRQFAALFKPQTQKTLLDFKKLAEMNQESLSVLANPKTGQRGLEVGQMFAELLKILAGGLAGQQVGANALVAGVLVPAVTILNNRWQSKLLTSEKFRNKVTTKAIRSLVRKEEKSKNSKTKRIDK